MEIVLNLTNQEIEEALLTYISDAGIDMEDKTTVIAVTAGRKGNGLRAEITINPKSTSNSGLNTDIVIDTSITGQVPEPVEESVVSEALELTPAAATLFSASE